MKKALLAIVLVGIGIMLTGCTSAVDSNPASSPVSSSDTKWCITPRGESEVCVAVNEAVGKSAAEALRLADSKSEKVKVIIEDTDFGEFITSVNDYQPDVQSEFWEFTIDGDPAAVGVGSYIVSSGDKLELRLSKFN